MPSRSPRQPTAIRVNQQASTEIVSKRAGRRSDDRRTSSSPGLLRSPPTRPGPASSLTWCLVILVAPTGRSRTSVPGTVPRMFGDHPAGLTGSRPYSAPHYPDYLAGHIRPCWPNHPEARWELAWLHQCGLSPIKPNELAARRCRQARPVGSRCHTQAWLSYGPLRPGLPANARCSHYTRLIEHADPGCELATTGSKPGVSRDQPGPAGRRRSGRGPWRRP